MFEKNADVGGTWLENVYPGCRVDVPNQLYSFSFAQTNEWASRFSAQPDLLAYLQGVAKELGLGDVHPLRHRGDRGRASTSGTGTWHARPCGAARRTRARRPRTSTRVVCAVGQLNRPSFPAIEGREDFAGPSFHSAAWDDTVDLAGQAGRGHRHRGQRSAVRPVPGRRGRPPRRVPAHPALAAARPTTTATRSPPSSTTCCALLPDYGRWDRLWQFWLLHEGLLVAARVDPDWDPHTEAVSAGNDFVRSMLLDVLRAQVADDELFEKMVPHFPPFAKRALRDDGRWAAACRRDHVDLVTTPIAADHRARACARRTASSTRPTSSSTGPASRASDFVAPMRVFGARRRRAQRGVGRRRPGLPRHHGARVSRTSSCSTARTPTSSSTAASWSWSSARCATSSRRSGPPAARRDTARCRAGATSTSATADEMEEGNARMVWGVADVPTWYRNKHGRVTQNWPFDLHTYWSRTLRARPGRLRAGLTPAVPSPSQLTDILALVPPDFADPGPTAAAVRAMLAPFHGHPVPAHCDVTETELGGVRCAWYDDTRAPARRPHVFHCHGGGSRVVPARRLPLLRRAPGRAAGVAGALG